MFNNVTHIYLLYITEYSLLILHHFAKKDDSHIALGVENEMHFQKCQIICLPVKGCD
jgi:hypothetical protein